MPVKALESFGPIGSGQGRTDPIWIGDDLSGNSFDKSVYVIDRHRADDIDKVLIPEGLIADRTAKLAYDLKAVYGEEELHMICLLKGSRPFYNTLISTMQKIYAADPTQTVSRYSFFEHFVRVQSYSGTESGDLTVTGMSELEELRGKHVVIVEDIIDTGKTLTQFCVYLEQYGAASVRTVSLLEKRKEGRVFSGDFVGFSIPDVFVVGCGLDYNDFGRQYGHVCVVSQHGVKKYAK
mmetsp:Transcript_39512/g.83543  ORF Transcript_39512/g.83543 Transcript_39512/m.83543 type:complete len:237 (+) Transcript_39512:37-747(+)